MSMTKRQVKAALGIETDAELARFFGVLKQAVGQWQKDEPIPEKRWLQLQVWRPDLFDGPLDRFGAGQPQQPKAA